MRLRMTIMLNQRLPGIDAYNTASAHSDSFAENARGISIGLGQNSSAFFPWSSILRIDYAPCDCDECRDVAPTATPATITTSAATAEVRQAGTPIGQATPKPL